MRPLPSRPLKAAVKSIFRHFPLNCLLADFFVYQPLYAEAVGVCGMH
jgi:hypothetical protein